jgi:cellobiose epimerase
MAELASQKQRLAGEFERDLRKLLDVWFPRSIDREKGGFLCDFDRRWKASGAQLKMLEFQARQTVAAARSAIRFPDLPQLREAAEHGYRYLKDRMWDSDLGGWYRLLDRSGQPLEDANKHGHGTSYAIAACVACHELTQNTECLELAKAAFAWLEKHIHDDKHGGYFVFYRRDGSPIVSRPPGARRDEQRDPIGTPIGFKDANTTSDLLKCFLDLYRVWPDALLRRRIEELLSIIRDRLIVAPGIIHMFAHPDWTPVPDLLRYGQALRSASHILEASRALNGSVDATTAAVSRAVVDTMLSVAWDSERGGFYLAGPGLGPAFLEGNLAQLRSKVWWVQADGLRTLLAAAHLQPGDTDAYEKAFVRQWEYIKAYLIDAKRGGWLAEGTDTNPAARKGPKAKMWKDASHETEVLLESLAVLSEL